VCLEFRANSHILVIDDLAAGNLQATTNSSWFSALDAPMAVDRAGAFSTRHPVCFSDSNVGSPFRRFQGLNASPCTGAAKPEEFRWGYDGLRPGYGKMRGGPPNKRAYLVSRRIADWNRNRMKVLFAIDGSASSFEAVGQVAPLLTPGKDEATLYCSPPQVRLESSSVSAELIPAARTALADAIFAEAAKRLPAEWHSTAARIVGTKDARLGILAAAEQIEADLIVVGARGLNRFERLLLGSVSRAVVHASHVPVWIARPRPATSNAGYHILLACETPERGRLPAQLLSSLSWPQATTCCALTVISSMFAGQVPQWLEQRARSPDVEEMVRKWAREHDEEVQSNLTRIQEFVKDLPGVFSCAKPLVAEGEPAEQILAAAVREHADLVVIGAQHQRYRAAAIFGSTSEAVLNHAGCSVLVVPHQETP